MRSIVELLSEKDLQNIAALYENPQFKSLARLVELERVECAKDGLSAWQADPKQIAYLAGGADKLKNLLKLIKDVNKLVNKKED